MIPITSSIEIDRPPDEVFAYVDDLERHIEWQDAIISARKEPSGPTSIGTRNTELRRIPGGPREIVSEIVEHDPPRRIVARGLNGPIRATITMTVAAIENGARSKLTFELALKGIGIGRLFAVFAGRSARKQVPRDLKKLKMILEVRT
jgi:uncharacterized membrane protein